MSKPKRLAWLVPTLALGAVSAMAAAAACAPDLGNEVIDVPDGSEPAEAGDFDSTPSPESGLGTMLFRPSAVFTGHDGAHTFVAPLAVYDAEGDLTVTADDPAVTVEAKALVNPVVDGVTDNGKYFFVSASKAGTFTLTASSQGRTATAALTVTAYDAARWTAGEARYMATGAGADQPCSNCHVDGQAVDHSPATMSSASDQDIGVIITTGIKPPAVPIRGVEGGHKWNVTDEQKDGLVTYLRALAPRGFQ